MPSASGPDETCWTVIRAAANGDAGARSMFSRSYQGMVSAYLAARWRGSTLAQEIADTSQDVLVECFKADGVLAKARASTGNFRALLFGVVRNVARRHEERLRRASRAGGHDEAFLAALPSREPELDAAFDRAWAQGMIRAAVERYTAQVMAQDQAARLRLQTLLLRVYEDLAIRDVAARLGIADVATVHNDYRRARRELERHLRQVVAEHFGPDHNIELECDRLLQTLRT